MSRTGPQRDPAEAFTQAIEQLLQHLEAEPEPVERARLATQHIAALQKARRRLAWLRMQAIADVKDHTDLSNRAIGGQIGVSANAVQQAHDEARGRPRRRTDSALP